MLVSFGSKLSDTDFFQWLLFGQIYDEKLPNPLFKMIRLHRFYIFKKIDKKIVWLVGFNGILTIVGYSMPNPLYIYIKYTWFGLVGFNGISTIVGYLMPNPRYIWFGLVGFYGISTLVGYLMPNPLIYTLNVYDLVWSGFMAYQPLSVI